MAVDRIFGVFVRIYSQLESFTPCWPLAIKPFSQHCDVSTPPPSLIPDSLQLCLSISPRIFPYGKAFFYMSWFQIQCFCNFAFWRGKGCWSNYYYYYYPSHISVSHWGIQATTSEQALDLVVVFIENAWQYIFCPFAFQVQVLPKSNFILHPIKINKIGSLLTHFDQLTSNLASLSKYTTFCL